VSATMIECFFSDSSRFMVGTLLIVRNSRFYSGWANPPTPTLPRERGRERGRLPLN